MSGKLEDVLVSRFINAVWDTENNRKPLAMLVPLKKVLNLIQSEKAMPKIKTVREQPTKELANDLKRKTLPITCFSGEFNGERNAGNLIRHTGLICIDFDGLSKDDVFLKKQELSKLPFIVSAFVSPSGNGVKAIIRVLDGAKHDGHYLALLREFPDADKSTKDVARACFDCADKDIYINYNATCYSKIITNERVYVKAETNREANRDFSKIEKWLEKRQNVYQSGNRNNFIYALASACCRFGIPENETADLITQNYLSKDSEYTVREMMSGIKSAYKSNRFASAEFTDDKLVEIETTKEIELDLNEDVVDVLYGKNCYEDALKIYNMGYQSAETTGITQIDRIFKWKRGEVTLLSGIGNFGKSEWLKFMMLNKSVIDGTKWAIFSPENYPAAEFYHDCVETLVGANCTPTNADGTPNNDKPREDIYEKAYNFVAEHFFYIYPKELSPTPEYIRSRFLELILKEKVDGVIIDPFNQMSNDYGQRDDRYLESFLAECCRFSILNNVFYLIVAHPHKLQKDKDTKAYPCPDVFDLAGGAMWNNKVDNILIFHRPNHHTDPMDRTCELHSKKIRRQKVVGVKGVEQFEYSRGKRRYVFDDCPLYRFIDNGINKPKEYGYVRNYSEPEEFEPAPF